MLLRLILQRHLTRLGVEATARAGYMARLSFSLVPPGTIGLCLEVASVRGVRASC